MLVQITREVMRLQCARPLTVAGIGKSTHDVANQAQKDQEQTDDHALSLHRSGTKRRRSCSERGMDGLIRGWVDAVDGRRKRCRNEWIRQWVERKLMMVVNCKVLMKEGGSGVGDEEEGSVGRKSA